MVLIKKLQSTYNEGIKDGIEREFDEEGNATKISTYIKGSLEGLANTFHKNGKIKEIKEYYENGDLKITFIYDENEVPISVNEYEMINPPFVEKKEAILNNIKIDEMLNISIKFIKNLINIPELLKIIENYFQTKKEKKEERKKIMEYIKNEVSKDPEKYKEIYEDIMKM